MCTPCTWSLRALSTNRGQPWQRECCRLPCRKRTSRWRLRRPGPRGRRWLTILVFLLAAILILLALWDWNWFKGPVERAVQARTGRVLRIGNLDVDLGRTSTIRADAITFANASWAKQPEMASADRVEIDVRVWPLLRGSVQLPEVRLTRPDVLLEPPRARASRATGTSSVTAPAAQARSSNACASTMVGCSSSMHWAAPTSAWACAAVSRTGRCLTAAAGAGQGHWQGNPFTLRGGTESPLELTDSDHPFRIHLDGRAGATHAVASGTLTNPFQLRVFDLQFALSGQDLSDLYPLLGIAIPPSPPYALDGRLKRDHNVWRYDSFTGKVGDSDLAGNLQFEVGRDRPRLTATLESRRLDFDDLAGFVGAPPKTGGGETANAEQKAQAARVAASSRVLPDTPYNLGNCVRWMPTCAGRPTASTRPRCHWTTWTRTCCWMTACCGWTR